MSDIFDKLEKNISENKNKAKEKKDQTDKLWIKYASEQKKIRKELNIEKDLVDLEKFVKKHIKGSNQRVTRSKTYVTITNTISLPDGFSENSVKLLYRNNNELHYSAKDKQLENYKHTKDSYVIDVKLLGDPDIDYVVTETVREEKTFKLKDKEKAYEYFNQLFQKNILYIGI